MGMAREWGWGALSISTIAPPFCKLRGRPFHGEDGRKEVKVILYIHKLVLYYQTSEWGIKGFRDLYCKTIYDFTREINR